MATFFDGQPTVVPDPQAMLAGQRIVARQGRLGAGVVRRQVVQMTLLATQRCPHCGSRRRRDWPSCWHCSPKERDDFEQVLEAIADSQRFRDDVGLDEILEPPGGFADYNDISGRERSEEGE